MRRAQRLAWLSCVLLWTAIARADDPPTINLLKHGQISVEPAAAAAATAIDLAALTDDDPSTETNVAVNNGEASLVIGFSGTAVALEGISIVVGDEQGPSEPPANYDLLVSSVSPQTGFQSVRSDRLTTAADPQEFEFSPIGAKWIMVRFAARNDAASVALAELKLVGHEGAPVTRYKFKESPAKAFDVLKQLQQNSNLNVTISADEQSLFRDAVDGKFDDWSFAEAALLASGVSDPEQRQEYLKTIEQIQDEAAAAVKVAKRPFDKGSALLKFLHAGPMSAGYKAEQTDVSGILTSKQFNCVSSAAFYNIIGRRLGLDLRAIEVPNHAFSILYDGSRHADVETTTDSGFDPARDQAAQAEFEKLTGFTYIPDGHREQRREVSEVGLVAIIYYNHGVGLTDEHRYHEALLAYFRAMSLDPEFDSAVKNALAVLANWGVELADDEHFEEALNVVQTGLKLAPEDATLLNNHKAVWYQWAESLMAADKDDEALEVLKRAAEQIPDGNFDSTQAWVFIRRGEAFIKNDEWQKALELVEPSLPKLSGNARQEFQAWAANLRHRWAAAEQQKGDFAAAVRLLKEALAADAADEDVQQHLVYIIQEWAQDVYEKQNAEASLNVLAEQLEAFSTMDRLREVAQAHAYRSVQDLVEKADYERALDLAARSAQILNDEPLEAKLAESVYDKWSAGLHKNGQSAEAIDVYQRGLERYPNNEHLQHNLQALWDEWADSYRQQGDWNEAIGVYERGRKQGADADRAERNIAYFIQEWAREVYDKQGAEAGERILQQQLERFPDLERVQDVARGHLQRVVQDLVGQQQYDQGLAVADRARELLNDERASAELSELVFDSQAQQFIEKQEWQRAIDIYGAGLKKLPDSSRLQANAVATWDTWAQIYIERKEWDDAIGVYKKALQMFPDHGGLKNNLEYCQQQK